MLKHIKELPNGFEPAISNEEFLNHLGGSPDPEYLEFLRMLTHPDFPRFWQIDLKDKKSISINDNSKNSNKSKKFNISIESTMFIDCLTGCFCIYDFKVKNRNKFVQLPWYISNILECIDHWEFFNISNLDHDWVKLSPLDLNANVLSRADYAFDENYWIWQNLVLEKKNNQEVFFDLEKITDFANCFAVGVIKFISRTFRRIEDFVRDSFNEELENLHFYLIENFGDSDEASPVTILKTNSELIDSGITEVFLETLLNIKTKELYPFKNEFSKLVVQFYESDLKNSLEDLLSAL